MAGRATRWNRTSIVAALRKAGRENGRWIPMAQWSAAHRNPSYQTVLKFFPTWGDAWTKAGYPPPERWQARTYRRWTDAEIAEALRRAADGRPLSSTRYDRWQRSGGDGPCITIVQRRLGSWRAVSAFSGVPTTRDTLHRADVVEAMATLWRERGREPTVRDWSVWSDRPCSIATVQKRFGFTISGLRAEALAAHPGLPTGISPSKALRRLLAVPRDALTEREREIAERAERGETLRQIGEALGFSREMIRQIAIRGGRRRGRLGGRGRALTAEEMVSLLRRRFGETGQIPTLQEWMVMRARPSAAAILRHFGTWRSAWGAALGAEHPAVQALKRRRGVCRSA